MSTVAPDAQKAGPAWDRLELAVRRLLSEYRAWRRRARLAEQRVQELEATVRQLSGGALDPVALAREVESLRAENAGLRQRIERARAGVGRILSRLDFLQEGR